MSGRPCELCGNVGRADRFRCPCGGRHYVCLLCVIAQELVDTERTDTDTLRVCPDALAIAATLMHEEPKVEVPDVAPAPLVTQGSVLPASTTPPPNPVEGDMYYNPDDNVMRAYHGGQWVAITQATP